MPTAAKLVAAFVFALLGFVGAETIKPLMREGTQFGYFSLVAAGVGLLCGWTVMGKLVGETYMAAIGFGLRTVLTMVFYSVLILAIYEMVLQSMDLRYDGVFEAIEGAMGIAVEYLSVMRNWTVIGTLVIGGAICGMIAEWAGRRWR